MSVKNDFSGGFLGFYCRPFYVLWTDGCIQFSWLYQHQSRYVLSNSIHFCVFFSESSFKKVDSNGSWCLCHAMIRIKRLYSSGWKLIQVPLLMDKPTKHVVLMSVDIDNIHLNPHPGDIPKYIFPIDQQKNIFLEFTIQYSI